jgi:hypothetical protein
MLELEATSRLSAVNGMLATIGEAPINSLEDTSLVDVAVAKGALDEVTRALLVDGWSFNTDEDYPLYPEGFAPFAISVPSNAMVCLPSSDFAHITVRGNRLYDTKRFSFDFQDHPAVPCKMVWRLDFADLPEVTRQYIAVRAARLFQARTTASDILHQFTNADEQAARWTHQRNNVRVRRRRYLTDSSSVANILAR